MAEKLPSQAWSAASLAEGNDVLRAQQVKLEPDTQAMEDEPKDPDFFWGLCLPFCTLIGFSIFTPTCPNAEKSSQQTYNDLNVSVGYCCFHTNCVLYML